MEPWDVLVVGGGILGTSMAHWLAERHEGRIAVAEREFRVAEHTSRRNTGVIHRPFYLEPASRRVFARSAQTAYGMWKAYAAARGLPWSPVGTLDVATDEARADRLETYLRWGLENGMAPEELEVLAPEDVRRIEPHIRSHGAIWCKTDTAVDYRAFTESLREDAERTGAVFLMGCQVASIEPAGDVLRIRLRKLAVPAEEVAVDPRRRIRVAPRTAEEVHEARFLVNCAGGHAIDIAHMLGVGLDYTDLHFRGEYWTIRPEWAYLARRNIYTVPRHPELPFLDPHWIVRADGRREIGPNAVPVAGPTTYEGFLGDPAEVVRKLLEPPMRNKLRLFVNPDFLSLATEESVSSLSRAAMAKRVREFLPDLREAALGEPGTAGIRASVIDRRGAFVKEAIELATPNSYHILNYNSPGATGAPAYTAWLVRNLAASGLLDRLRPKQAAGKRLWDFEAVCAAIDAPAP